MGGEVGNLALGRDELSDMVDVGWRGRGTRRGSLRKGSAERKGKE